MITKKIFRGRGWRVKEKFRFRVFFCKRVWNSLHRFTSFQFWTQNTAWNEISFEMKNSPYPLAKIILLCGVKIFQLPRQSSARRILPNAATSYYYLQLREFSSWNKGQNSNRISARWSRIYLRSALAIEPKILSPSPHCKFDVVNFPSLPPSPVFFTCFFERYEINERFENPWFFKVAKEW